jgi:hypothetical protein
MKKAILLSLLLVLSSCGYRPSDDGRPRQIGKDESGAALRFGSIEQVEGTRFFTLPIVRSDRRGEDSFSSGYGSLAERNRLIVDSINGTSRRVLPNERFSIVNWIEPKASISMDDQFVERATRQPSDEPSGLYAAVVKRPGAKDKDDAKYDVLLGRFEDAKQGWIAQGLDGVQAIWMTPDGKLAMVAAAGDGGIYRLYDPKTFRQLLESKLTV